MRPFGIRHLIRQPAGLAAIAAIGTAPGMRVADVALAAVGDAQRAVDEEFQRGAGLRPDRRDLLQRQFTRQHQLRQADILQKACLLRRADVGLRAGVQLDRRQVEFQQAHVLDDQRIDASVVHLPDQFARRFQLVVAQDGVERGEDARVEPMRVFHQPGDVGHAVVGAAARTERRSADIHRICAMIDRFDADVGIARRSEKFELMVLHAAIIARD
jgi:hypothetical protein